MSTHLKGLVPVATLALALAACVPPPPQPATSPVPTASAGAVGTPSPAPTATAAATATPTAAPGTAAPSATPTVAATPSPSAAPAFDMAKGKLLRRYDFKGIGGVYVDRSHDQILVVDATNDDVTPRRFLLRTFTSAGVFVSAVDLQPTGEKAPDGVDGVAFDLTGTPFFTYREDQRFRLYQLFTATVRQATRLPVSTAERAGLSALGSDGDVITLGLLRYDPEKPKTDTSTRTLVYARGAEGESPEAVVNIPDPLSPTVRMAVAPGGVLYIAGPKGGNVFGLMRLDAKDQQPKDAFAIDRLPDHVWTAPDGDVLLAFETPGNAPATVKRYAPDGTLRGEAEVRLESGGYLFNLAGVAFDAAKGMIVAGNGYENGTTPIEGLFTY